MARSNFAANRVTGEGRLQQRLRFVTAIYAKCTNAIKCNQGTFCVNIFCAPKNYRHSSNAMNATKTSKRIF